MMLYISYMAKLHFVCLCMSVPYMAGCERQKEEVLVVSRRETHVFLYVVVSVIHFPLLHPAILAFDSSRKPILWLQLTLFVWLPV